MSKVISISPSTEEVYGELPETSYAELQGIVKAARSERIWRNTEMSQRIHWVMKLAHLLEQRKGIIARTMAEEMGKPLKAGRHEIDLAIKRIQAYGKQIPSFLDDEILYEDDKEKYY